MTLLFDQNLSHRLIAALGDLFPGALHVRGLGMDQADDLAIWEHARVNKLVIVTQDADYSDWNSVVLLHKLSGGAAATPRSIRSTSSSVMPLTAS